MDPNRHHPIPHVSRRAPCRGGSAIPPRSAASFAALALACFVASPSVADAKDAMAECSRFVDGWKAAYNAKDAQTLAGMYEPKKGTYSNVFWTGTGRDVLAGGFKQELGMGSTMTSIKCETSNASGDLVVSKGTWSASSPGPGGQAMTVGGHWQSSAVGRAGKYLIVDHISNMQLPPPK